MQSLLRVILKRFILSGCLTVYWPDGSSDTFRGSEEPVASMRLRDSRTIRRLATNPGLALGEAYMNGGLIPVNCDIRAVLEVLIINLAKGGSHAGQKVQAFLRHVLSRVRRPNSQSRAQQNVAHHYNFDNTLYRLFLDRDMQYSCAYFETGSESLEEAQEAKKRHIAAKLLLNRPDLRVLDIGCGWGGLALTLARDFGARVTGITLSSEQLAVAQARAAASGLSDRVSFRLLDYRGLDQKFDRIVSVGMFEHVGIANYNSFFETAWRSLEDDGVMLLHSIGCSGPPSASNAWLTKYIFPGGYSPSLSEVLPHVERAGMIVTDIEVLRMHYATTLACWQERFQANRRITTDLYDERFCKMFEFYLAGCELAFRHQGEMTFQMQLARRQEAVPTTRNYLQSEPIPVTVGQG